MTTPVIFQAMVDIQKEISTFGIQKNSQNQQQRYQFRGIDDVLNTLSPLLSKHNVIITPEVIERNITERTTARGGVLFYVTVKVNYHFISSADGSKHIVTTYGEAMDSADKATNKALSAAYKYMAIQAFCIPVQGTPDADSETHEVQSKANWYAGRIQGAQTQQALQQVANELKAETQITQDERQGLIVMYQTQQKKVK